MGNKKIQKMFYYTSESNKRYIEGRIEDLAEKTDRTSSYIIESFLLDILTPQNEDVAFIVKNSLYPDNCIGGVKKTITELFSYNAQGSAGWKSRYSNLKPVVEYCINYISPQVSCVCGNGDLYYLKNQLKNIVERIENCIYSCIEPYDKMMYLSCLEEAKHLLKMVEDGNEGIGSVGFYKIIIDCWEMLDDWSFTYRYLMSVSKMCEFQETADARNELYELIVSVSMDWKKEGISYGNKI